MAYGKIAILFTLGRKTPGSFRLVISSSCIGNNAAGVERCNQLADRLGTPTTIWQVVNNGMPSNEALLSKALTAVLDGTQVSEDGPTRTIDIGDCTGLA